MRNNKGFTLIELLVTIALMLSILAIAVVSVIKVRDMRKEDAYTSVKEQIITAAEHYFEDNAYYKENLSKNGDFIVISLGKLVDEDYLNVVTNPITRKKINKCSYVELTLKDNQLKTEFKEDEKEDCLENSYISITNVPNKGPIPKIEVEVIASENMIGKDGWYKMNKDDEDEVPIVKISAKDADNIMYSWDKGEKFENLETEFEKESDEVKLVARDSLTYSKSTASTGRTVTYKATNEYGNSATTEITKKVDLSPPWCKINVVGTTIGEENKIYNYTTTPLLNAPINPPRIKINYYDNFYVNKEQIKEPGGTYKNYGIINYYTQLDTKGAYVTWQGKAEDSAGNIGECVKQIIVEKTDKTSDVTYTKCGETTGENRTWTNNNVTIKQCFDTVSLGKIDENGGGCIEQQFTTSTKTTKIKKENTGANCEVDVYVDKDKPYFKELNFEKGTPVITLTQQENNGTPLASETISLAKENNKYVGYACLSLQTKGSFNFKGFSYNATDDLSGIEKYQPNRKVVQCQSDLKKCSTTAITHCYKNESPCKWEDIWYAYDRAGNISDNFGKIIIYVGYKGKDYWCK